MLFPFCCSHQHDHQHDKSSRIFNYGILEDHSPDNKALPDHCLQKSPTIFSTLSDSQPPWCLYFTSGDLLTSFWWWHLTASDDDQTIADHQTVLVVSTRLRCTQHWLIIVSKRNTLTRYCGDIVVDVVVVVCGWIIDNCYTVYGIQTQYMESIAESRRKTRNIWHWQESRPTTQKQLQYDVLQ